MANVAHSERTLRSGTSRLTAPFGRRSTRVVTVLRDRAVVESAALAVPVALVGWAHGAPPALWALVTAYLCANVAVAAHTASRTILRPRGRGWTAARLVLSVFVVAAAQALTREPELLAMVYLPVVAVSAFGGRAMLAFAVVLSIAAQIAAEAASFGIEHAVEHTLSFGAVVLIVAIGTRRQVVRGERARRRMRRAVTADRRRSRQIAGVEAIGRILAASGPTPDALEEVVGRISTALGYPYVSIYLGDESRCTLGAQRGYARHATEFDGRRGIVGRVMRTQEPVFVPDVQRDPDYLNVHDDVTSEICVPLLADGSFLGFVNVESTAASPLDSTDLRVMVAVADRIAAALIIGRDRQRLAERGDVFRQLYDFGEAINATLQPDELFAAIVRSVSGVVRADAATLHVIERESGRYLLAAAVGREQLPVGTEARPGEGMAGRAIRDRTVIIDDALPRARPARAGAGFLPEERTTRQEAMLGVAVPLVRDRAVLGVLTLMRDDSTQRFSEPELDALRMLGEQAVLAITNTFLHAEVAELAMRDPLTGLFNRRFLDPALEQLFAQRARVPAEERVPLAAIMFDLDHFSEFNNRHGHHVGDEVLRTFATILRSRMRASDFVARFGGEEFAAILFRATLDDAVQIAESIREQLAGAPISGSNGEPLSATVSAGVAAVGPDNESVEELLRAADVALYMAKRAGRDRVCAA